MGGFLTLVFCTFLSPREAAAEHRIKCFLLRIGDRRKKEERLLEPQELNLGPQVPVGAAEELRAVLSWPDAAQGSPLTPQPVSW